MEKQVMAVLVAAVYGIIAPSSAIAQSAHPAAGSQAPSPIVAATDLARWQLKRLEDASHISRVTGETRNPRSWEQAVFWIGMTALADGGAPRDMHEAILDMGRRNRWMPGDNPFFADDHAITQAYIWASRNGAGAVVTGPTRTAFNRILTEPQEVSLAFYVPKAGYGAAECLVRWCWCDALFMAPPAMLALAQQTGDRRLREHVLKEWWATTDFLYDPAERLFYRDSRFFERRDAKERKLFWARGNGWVLGGMARAIPLLDRASADRGRMIALFRAMSSRLADLQKPDGYWAPSLLAPEGSPPETSGTGFFVYGIAWGINTGLLDRARFEPVARRGWQALLRAIQPDGRLGYVQQVSDRPEEVLRTDTQFYGVGAFLLAASEISKLDRGRQER